MFKQSFNSLNLKITSIFIILGLFLLTILFVQVVPKMHKEQKEYTKKQIENMIYLTTQQLKLATKVLEEQSIDKIEYQKSIIESKVENIKNNFQNLPKKEKQNYLNTTSKDLECEIFILNKNNEKLFTTIQKEINLKQMQLNTWNIIKDNSQKTVCPLSPKHILFSKQMGENKIALSCQPFSFDNMPMKFELKLKQDIQKSFELLDNMHKGKIYLMWINNKNLLNSNIPLYNSKDDHFYNNKYCISKISNLKFPKTGKLSGKQIIEAIDKEPIQHLLDKDFDKGNFIHPALTWVRSLNNDPNRQLLFITTIFSEDFDNHLDSSFWKILPASLIALIFAIILGFFLFKKIFTTISILSNTAYKVNKGDLNIRSNIKEKDDIGVLGKTFDKMLDSLEKNIQLLDKKVALKTKELQSSLEEKETLLKEIHHRVKNNLAMTIDLIKIQKIKVKDTSVKEVLTDIQERIYTMELLHRKLYESPNLSSIDIKKYIEQLSSDLLNSYNQDKKIEIVNNIIEISMDIEYALPCGLIINEALTNSLKHAFNDTTNCKIFISLKQDNNTIILKIEDNGKGLAKDIDIYNCNTLGLKLLRTIVKNQLLGELYYTHTKNSTFTIKFNLPTKAPS